MAKQFEDLKVWQQSRKLAEFVYQITGQGQFSKDYGLVDQIRRAAVSVMSNIAEGFERGSNEETIYFFYIAKGSCGEVRSQLYVALDMGYIDKTKLEKGLMLAKDTSKMLYYFIESLKGSKFKGLKFKPVKDKGKDELYRLMREHIPKQYWSEELKRRSSP